MANRLPLALVGNEIQEMPSGDVLPVAAGGTGAPDATSARANIGAASATALETLEEAVAALDTSWLAWARR